MKRRRLAIKLLIAAIVFVAGLYALVRLDNWYALRQVEQTPPTAEPAPPPAQGEANAQHRGGTASASALRPRSRPCDMVSLRSTADCGSFLAFAGRATPGLGGGAP